MQNLTTDRLLLEPQSVSHAERLFHLFQDPELHRWTTRTSPESLEKFTKRIRFLEGRHSPDGSEYWINWVVLEKESGQVAGQIEVSMIRQTGHAFLAYTVFKAFQKRGFAKEGCAAIIEHLFSAWNASMIVIEMDTRNEASVRLAESLGASRVQHNQRVQLLKGEWSDEYRYELRREY